jgi:hypothetical protein
MGNKLLLKKPQYNVFIIAGQSNASGRGTNNQTFAKSSVYDSLFLGNDYLYKTMADPIDSNTNQIDTISSDSIAAGSVWPLVATGLSALGKYTIFVPCAMGGTFISQWREFAGGAVDRSTLYGSMCYRALQAATVGTLRGVLVWIGESNAISGTSQVAFNADIDTFANNVKSDIGVNSMFCKLQTCTGISQENQDAINAAIAEAWGDNSNVMTGPDLTSISTDDSYHIKIDDKLASAATLWIAAIKTALSW